MLHIFERILILIFKKITHISHVTLVVIQCREVIGFSFFVFRERLIKSSFEIQILFFFHQFQGLPHIIMKSHIVFLFQARQAVVDTCPLLLIDRVVEYFLQVELRLLPISRVPVAYRQVAQDSSDIQMIVRKTIEQFDAAVVVEIGTVRVLFQHITATQYIISRDLIPEIRRFRKPFQRSLIPHLRIPEIPLHKKQITDVVLDQGFLLCPQLV